MLGRVGSGRFLLVSVGSVLVGSVSMGSVSVELAAAASSTADLASRLINIEFSFLFRTSKFNTEFNRHGRPPLRLSMWQRPARPQRGPADHGPQAASQAAASKQPASSQPTASQPASQPASSQPAASQHPAIHPISQPASIFDLEQKALWGQVSVSGSVRAEKDASISRLNGRF